MTSRSRSHSHKAKPTSGGKSGGKAAKAEFTSEQLHAALKRIHRTFAESSSPRLLPLLAQENLSNVLLLLGAEQLRIKRMIAWIREHFFSGNLASVCTFFGGELSSAASVAAIKGTLGNLSLFSPEQLIVIYDADKVKTQAAEGIAGVLPQSQGSALVLIIAEALSDKAPLLAKAKQIGKTVSFSALTGPMLERWMNAEAERQGAGGITPEAVQLLQRAFGADLDLLAQEIAKVALLAQPGERIDRQHVSQRGRRPGDAKSFDLVDQIAKKNVVAAAALVRDLLTQGMHPLQISSFLSKVVRTLIVQQQPPGEGIPGELNNPWFIRNLGSAPRLFKRQELLASLEVLAELDFQLKDNKIPDTLALSLAIEKIALRRMPPPQRMG